LLRNFDEYRANTELGATEIDEIAEQNSSQLLDLARFCDRLEIRRATVSGSSAETELVQLLIQESGPRNQQINGLPNGEPFCFSGRCLKRAVIVRFYCRHHKGLMSQW
jgi:hypothetical protein